MKNRKFRKLNKIKKIVIAGFVCLAVVCVNSIPYFSEDITTFESYVDVEEKIDEITDEIKIIEDETEEIVEDETDEIEEKINGNIEYENEIVIEVEENEVKIIEDVTIESDEIIELSKENVDIINPVTFTQNIEEVEKEVATASELEEIEVATPSMICIKVFWIDSMDLNESGISGSYNYKWDTFTVKKGEDFIAPDNVIKDIKHSSCNQVYKFVGFTTEDQKTKYWLHADYAAGEIMFDKTFSAEKDLVVWAVYEAKDTYISSIKLVDGELIFKATTIPNIAIKNIIVSDEAFENLKNGYKVLKKGDRYIAYTKDSKEGNPILEMDVKKKVQE